MTIILSSTLTHIIIPFACSVNCYHFDLLFLMSMDTMSLAMKFKCLFLSLMSNIFICLCMWIFTLFFDKFILEILGRFWTFQKSLKIDDGNFYLITYLFDTSKCSHTKMYLGKVGHIVLGQHLLLYYYFVRLTIFSIWMSCLYKKFYAPLIIVQNIYLII